ncbi:hypothetical protein DID75_04900 [Candidatus Marinamargulisbacteria bacterium SCGC AG-410-N11]|nr:hypothetical protein DID75_04900 [Candidatus Marinamargulisbacteria bacterium SCGC AG-410-N11]
MIFFASLLSVFLISGSLLGHPVIWKGGLVLSSKFTSNINEIKTHYSLNRSWALGLHSISFNQQYYYMLQNNLLVKRWNSKGSQGNLYLFSGIGSNVTKNPEAIGHLGIQSDWETRRIYTQFSMDHYPKKQPITLLSGRLGIAPYLTDFDGIHTWVILQLDQVIKVNQSETTIMPLFRFFKDNLLLECGSNFNNKYLLTFMFHI